MRKSFQDLTGCKFGTLTVIKLDRRENNRTYWTCRCDCGNTVIVRADTLKTRQSCGCLRSASASERCGQLGKRRTTHGCSQTRIYKIYSGIKERCYNKNNLAYKNYGQRGIVMCDEWLCSPQAFINWALSHGYNPELTIDRIDNNKSYCPENCRWATRKTQGNNKRNNIKITYNGQSFTLPQIADKFNESYKKLYSCFKRNGNIDKIIK